MSPLRRDFLPDDLQIETQNAGVSGVVSVQARQNLGETRALLGFAAQHEWILGVVGWVPLQSPQISQVLAEFAGQKKLKGVRHVVQDEADDFLENTSFNRGVAALRDWNLTYDILVFERQLSAAIHFVDAHPQQKFVLDHAGKPQIRGGDFAHWRALIREISRRPNVWCKVSGLVTEAFWHDWTPASLEPYFQTVWEFFGPKRAMWGSDWPVCEVACPYGKWAQTCQDWTADFSDDERKRFFEQNAREFYGLSSG